MEHYAANLRALGDLIAFCQAHDIRLRAVWMPLSDYIGLPENPTRVIREASEILSGGNVEVWDMTDALPRDCFHDLGHLNKEHGAYVFTMLIDPWLGK